MFLLEYHYGYCNSKLHGLILLLLLCKSGRTLTPVFDRLSGCTLRTNHMKFHLPFQLLSGKFAIWLFAADNSKMFFNTDILSSVCVRACVRQTLNQA